MDTIKIGTSENCDIKFYGKDITSSVWATISASDKKMLVLKILANNVRCFVNNNNVADQYWIKYGDEICINDYTLDWNRINALLYDDEKISNWERLEKPLAFAPRWRVALTPSGEIVLTLLSEIKMPPEKQTFFRSFFVVLRYLP